MKPRLATQLLLCAAVAAAAAGCRWDQEGLKGPIAAPPKAGDPPDDEGVDTGGGSSTPNPPKVEPPTPPAPALAPDAGTTQGIVGDDAGAPVATPDAEAPAADTAPAPVSSRPPECDKALSLPLRFTYRSSVPDSDDFTFDNDGYFLARSGRDIARLAYGGLPEMVVKNVVSANNTIDSLRVLPDGDIVFVDYMGDAMIRVDARGVRRKIADLEKPNKLAIGPGGFLYVVAIEGEIFRVNPATNETKEIARVNGRLRGLTFSPDYKTMYVSDPRNDVLHSLALRTDGSVDQPRIFARNMGNGPDGLATDVCGNVYVADFEGAPLRRVTPSGTVQILANLDRPTSSVGFGSGKQGWDSLTLYTVSVDRGGTYEIKIGVGAAAPPPASSPSMVP
jgi:sugar lactone lactonase YvrE